ncbi:MULTISPECIES: four-helix bundle copper-binding protein [Bacillota]|uniref:Four-helix bundle copper-binding protein n=7 Tax=Lachnospiraceae TaxID=186803 RepID=A0AAW4UBS3_9FIRM|nr:four-helix bundle copper-binding protein [Mediterraneibacter faecis]MCB5382666.1 four-helix bundle copper-binding protein [Blautia glucerasea]MCB5428393.1 four-helix bundle copper-binding protein [Catenibacterium mitsuokai]MCB5432973.1 four-helix bundle copper-binding protein [Blautia faecis]MCB5480018.1 four-helix bundle copper-binding protein [Roseburia faecis]MCB5501306.1 four-helix bundle copper-binding protein [Dorea formicigenerans]MCB5515859.1 four-helix bundle copper-binding protei
MHQHTKTCIQSCNRCL